VWWLLLTSAKSLGLSSGWDLRSFIQGSLEGRKMPLDGEGGAEK
jgi:hypothetical protein